MRSLANNKITNYLVSPFRNYLFNPMNSTNFEEIKVIELCRY